MKAIDSLIKNPRLIPRGMLKGSFDLGCINPAQLAKLRDEVLAMQALETELENLANTTWALIHGKLIHCPKVTKLVKKDFRRASAALEKIAAVRKGEA